MENENLVMTPKEISKLTHCSLPFIYKQLRNGVIPNKKLGDKYLISRKAFEIWLNDNTHEK
jgi:excisionase family DNA binding protein